MEFEELLNHPIEFIEEGDPRFSSKALNRFVSKLTVGDKPENLDTPCLEWIGAKQANGYGKIKIDGKIKAAHRLSWEISSRIELPKNICACHKCDNPGCISPIHLFPGTNAENTHDMMDKGRAFNPPGRAKLTEEKVTHIRNSGMSVKEASVAYPEVKERNLRDVIYGRTWKDVK